MCVVGQCSLSAALPVLSTCGVEACPLPTSLLSTHSVGFGKYSHNSLFNEAKSTLKALISSDIRFDGVLSMYLAHPREAELVHEAKSLLKENGMRFEDPAMADLGKLYPNLSPLLAEEMAALAAGADVITPNFTEACLLAREDFRESYDRDFVRGLARDLVQKLSAKRAVITGVELEQGKIGAFAFDGKNEAYFSHEKQDRVCHGAGDLFSCALAGLSLAGEEFFEAAKRAEDFTYASILATIDDPEHFYGMHFEKCLEMLTKTH